MLPIFRKSYALLLAIVCISFNGVVCIAPSYQEQILSTLWNSKQGSLSTQQLQDVSLSALVPNLSKVYKIISTTATEQLEEVDITVINGSTITPAEPTYNVSAVCMNHTLTILDAMLEKQLWAFQFADAAAKPPAGLLQGAFTWLGAYDECRSIIAVEGGNNSLAQLPKFHGKYCLSTIGTPSNVTSSVGFLPGMAQEGGINVNYGVCVPDSCSEEDVRQLLYTALYVVPPNALDVKHVYCKEEQEFDARALFALCLCGFFLLLLMVGTLYDVFVHHIVAKRIVAQISANTYEEDTEYKPLLSKTDDAGLTAENYLASQCMCLKIILCFSLYTNLGKLLSTKKTAGQLTCIHGIRFLSLSWVILGHTYAFSLPLIANPLAFATVVKSFWFQTILNATFSVDSFFVMSGLLLTYLFLKEMKAKGSMPVSLPMFYFHRFWRLTPPYMLVLGLHVCLFKYFADGPMWPSDGIEKDSCRSSWWKNILYINNLFSSLDGNMCMAWSWYLSNDMQFFAISPIILIALYKSAYLGLSLIGGLIALHVTVTSAIVAVNDLPPNFPADMQDPNAMVHVLEMFDKVYFKPWCRVGAYAVGMAVGYAIYRTEGNFRMRKWQVVVSWLLAAFFCLSTLYGLYGYYNGNEWLAAKSAFYSATCRIAWSVGLGLLILNCIHGYGGVINSILSWQGFIPLSRLSYCAYLVHPIVIYAYFYSRRELVMFTHFWMVVNFLGIAVMAYSAAAVISLTFEAPMMALEKIIFKNRRT